MTFAFAGAPTSPRFEEFARHLSVAAERRRNTRVESTDDAELVLNLVSAETARPFRRKSRGTFAAAIQELPEVPEDVLKVNYPLLVRALANISLCYVPGRGVWFTTMERGHYGVEGEDDVALAEGTIDRLVPLAESKLVIDDEVTEEIREAGIRMGDLDLLPAPFPIEDLLSERELRHVKRLYGIGGLSYGNLSSRKDETRFWMSASGVDKTKLDVPGRDILLVSGYDPVDNKMILSVPPNVEPRRVSVDAIEHWMIYQAHPDIGAILHVHAWVEGIPATDVNYPCGTEELAVSVSELLAREDDPAHAVIGIRNHGINATGESLTEILDRIEPRVLRQIPMS